MKPRIVEKIKCVKCELAFEIGEGYGLNFGWFEYMWLGLCKKCSEEILPSFLSGEECEAVMLRLGGWGYMESERESIHLLHMIKSKVGRDG